MINVSNEFKTAMKQPVKELDAYIKLSEEDKITSADDLIEFKISCETGMCKTAMRKLEAKHLGSHNLIGKWVNVGFGVKLPNGNFEYLDYGSFLITEISTSKDTGVTQIIGYDKMINTMKEYKTLTIEYPINLYEYTKTLCNVCGLELLNTTFVHADWEILQELWENIDGITYRDILVQIAQATASTCIITNDDKIYFKSIYNTSETLTYDNLKTLKLEPIYGEINSVVLSRTPQEDNIYMQDEESIEQNGLTEFKIENNEIIDKDRDNAMTPIYNALHGISYYPFEATTEGLGWYEIADNFNIVNDTNDVFNTTLFNFSITIDGGIKESLKTIADTKTQTQYQYATISKRVKNTEIIVNKQEQYIEQLVSDMYQEDGVVHNNFTNIYQDIDNIVNSVQNTGGSNLIKNSVMFAQDTDGTPTDWIVGNNNGTYNVLTYDGYFQYSFFLGEDGYYESNNQGVSNSYAMCELQFYMPENNGTLELSCINYAESNYDYGILSKIDTGLKEGYDSTTDYLHTYKSFKGQSSINPQTVLYENITAGTHSIFIKYQKDGSGNTNNDSFKFKVVHIGNADEEYTGTLKIVANTDALKSGAISGNEFILNDMKVSQTIKVKADSDDIPLSEKTYYSFSTKIKKDITGSCYVKIYNLYEEYVIELNEGDSSYYGDYELKKLLPQTDYYIIEFYGSADSNATFTDNMFAVGEYRSQWEQANGEIMNTQVNINLNGILVKSSVYLGDYTAITPLEFAGYSKINGTITKVFSLNKDVTLVKKLEAEDEIKMIPIKVVPITNGELQGWAFVPSSK